MAVRTCTGIFRYLTAVILLLVSFCTISPAADKNSPLSPEDYRKVLLKFVKAVEDGDHQGLWGNIKRHVKDDTVLEQNSIVELIKTRAWRSKEFYDAELAAYRQIGDNVNQVFIVVLTDRGPFCWKFDLFKVRSEWYIASFTVKKGVDMIAGGYELYNLLSGKKSDVLKVETVTPSTTVKKEK